MRSSRWRAGTRKNKRQRNVRSIDSDSKSKFRAISPDDIPVLYGLGHSSKPRHAQRFQDIRECFPGGFPT